MTARRPVESFSSRQARHWLAALAGRPDAATQAAFERWHAAHPANALAWDEAMSLWQATDAPARRLAADDASALHALLERMDAPAPPRAFRRITWASAAVVVLALGALIGGWRPDRWVEDLAADHVCPAGPVCNVTLADGSELTLDAGSAIAVDLSSSERHVELRRGAVFFKVAHTGAPFVVQSGASQVRVLGTEFAVRQTSGGGRVTVLAGRVSVRAAPGEPEQVLQGNQQVSWAGGHAGEVAKVDSAAQLAWREGWLTWYQAPLSEVVAELEPYYPGRIVVLGDALGQRTLSGSFPTKDPQAVLGALQKILGFEQHHLPGPVILLR
ncbi:FecR family protein [Pseudomonas sp. KNUC1026]|uniref:FecR family protein n=1 Tax=Pseudomonas sp. KNUC1026 TaxID=2893890 RepID=UPI001F18891F|nr:FecR family protein [Pseudomonas sp. KNUC1026]UFH50187.1 FecR family protein [Pseudomonas sp. KNUC1026]